MQVEKNRIISMRYIMKNGSGIVLEDNMMSEPVNYLHGSGNIEALLQEQLEGLKPGDRKKLYLFASSGLTTDNYEFDVIIDGVKAATPEEILLGYPVHTLTGKCEEDCQCYSKPD